MTVMLCIKGSKSLTSGCSFCSFRNTSVSVSRSFGRSLPSFQCSRLSKNCRCTIGMNGVGRLNQPFLLSHNSIGFLNDNRSRIGMRENFKFRFSLCCHVSGIRSLTYRAPDIILCTPAMTPLTSLPSSMKPARSPNVISCNKSNDK